MKLPFTREQFFEVFAAYNNAVWPAQLMLSVLAIAMLAMVLRAPKRAGRFVSFSLAFLWAWLGLAYHLAFFWAVNLAAPVFAAISLAASVAFFWIGGLKHRLQFAPGMPAQAVLGLIIAIFALVGYPTIGLFIGHRYPAAPTFGLPCPTAIFTFGMLLMASASLPKVLVVGPLLWAVIGSFAAFALGVTEDLALVFVAVLGVFLLFRSSPPAIISFKADDPE